MDTAEEVLRLYKEVYFDLNMRHFHEKLREEHAIELSYTWVQQALQGAGLVVKRRKRGPHRRRRPRRPMIGMLLHIDGSKHRWLNDDRWYDLIVILDDANEDLLCAVGGGRIDSDGDGGIAGGDRSPGACSAPCTATGKSLFRDGEGGGKVEKHRLTQVGRAMKVGVQMIAAYSPQARGRKTNAVLEPGKGGCRKNCGWLESARWRAPTRFCGSTTSRSSTASSK